MSDWKRLLLRIGDKCQEYGSLNVVDLKEHIETCFGAVIREVEHSMDEILPFFIQCVEQLPHKIPSYGTLVGLLNLENEDFVQEVVRSTHINLQDALNCGHCNRIRILVRFLTAMMCSKVLLPDSLIVVFETLLSSAATTVDEEKGNPCWQPRADFYVTSVLSSLPWGGAELVEQVPEEIDRLLVEIEAYLRIRRSYADVSFSPFVDPALSKSSYGKDFLEDLWERVQILSQNGWNVESVPKPHLHFEAQLVVGRSHEFGAILCPDQPNYPSYLSWIAQAKQKHEADLKYPQRIRRLNIFPPSKYEDVQPIDCFVVQEYLLDILLFFNGCRKECAAYMVGLPVPFRYEYVMAETIFSQLLLLPQPPFKPIYYTLVLMDLCKALPGAFPAVVASAVRTLFEKIADLDMECRTRLVLWFSHHLSNFQFIWPWEEWNYVLELPKWAPQRLFVQEVFEGGIRLSYWEKIKQSIENAPGLEQLLPPKGVSCFKYVAEDGNEITRQHELSAELSSMVKERITSQDVSKWIEETLLPFQGPDVAIEVILQTLLEIGSKSFTHLVTVLERYGQAIKMICPDPDLQIKLIAVVNSFWMNNTQMMAIAIDRMLGYRLISNVAVINWVFSAENVGRFHTSDRPWEVLRNTLRKTHNLIYDLRKEIANLGNVVVLADEASKKAKVELEAAESKLTLQDGQPVLGENPVRLKRLKSFFDKMKAEEVSVRESKEAKEAILARTLEESEAQLFLLYKNFSSVLSERLPDASTAYTVQADPMAVDVEASSSMQLDNENITGKSQSNGDLGKDNVVDEMQRWCLTTLGYVKAFSRQYASEIWRICEKLDTEILTSESHPLFRKAVYLGLGRASD